MANVKLKLLATYYRLPVPGASGSLLFQGQVFETDSDNAERLVKAGAAEKITDAQAKAASAADGGESPEAGDAGGGTKPARKTAASTKTAADAGGDTK